MDARRKQLEKDLEAAVLQNGMDDVLDALYYVAVKSARTFEAQGYKRKDHGFVRAWFAASRTLNVMKINFSAEMRRET